jgi:hypothetical protein
MQIVDFSQENPANSNFIDKVLRFWQAGHKQPTRLLRINRALPAGDLLAVRGK